MHVLEEALEEEQDTILHFFLFLVQQKCMPLKKVEKKCTPSMHTLKEALEEEQDTILHFFLFLLQQKCTPLKKI